MPITPVNKGLFPDVPNVLGVPALRRELTSRQATRLVISRILSRILLSRFKNRGTWGLYKADGTLIQADSVVSLDFKGLSKVSEVPLQNGSFAAYNKVQMPDLESLRLIKTGSDATRGQFLSAIDAAKKSTDLYYIVTPEKTYIDITIEEYDYKRTAQDGVSMLVVDIRFKQIRQVRPAFSTVKLEDAKTPTGLTPQSGGVVQALPVPPAAAQSIVSKFWDFATGN